MNWFDACVVAVLAVSALLAFLRGLLREVLAIAAWVGAGAAAYYLAPGARPQFRAWISDPRLADYGADAVVFVVALVLFSVVANLLGGVTRNSVLGGVDRSLGAVFGVVRGAVVVFAIYIVAGMVVSPDRWPEALTQARSVPYAYAGAVWLAGLLPDGYRPGVRPPPPGPATNAEDLLQPPPPGRAVSSPDHPGKT